MAGLTRDLRLEICNLRGEIIETWALPSTLEQAEALALGILCWPALLKGTAEGPAGYQISQGGRILAEWPERGDKEEDE